MEKKKKNKTKKHSIDGLQNNVHSFVREKKHSGKEIHLMRQHHGGLI